MVLGLIPEEQSQGSLFDTIDRTKNKELLKVVDSLNRSMA